LSAAVIAVITAHYVAVSRAKVGFVSSGDFGAFVLTLDEVGR
jgi:hypothetical protein